MADSKEEEKSWFAQAWDGVCNSALGRTIGIADKDNDKPGLWGMFKETIGLGSSDETKGKEENKSWLSQAWDWTRNSLLGRTFGLADKDNDKPGLWGMFKNSAVGRFFGLADKKEASANTATAQQTQVQTASNGAVNDDVIVETPSQYKVVSQEKSNTTVRTTSNATNTSKVTTVKAVEPERGGSGAKAAAEAAPRPPVTPSRTVPSGFEYEKFNPLAVDLDSTSLTVGGKNLSSKDVSNGLGLVTAVRNNNNGLTLNPDGSYNVENKQTKTPGHIQITLTGKEEETR